MEPVVSSEPTEISIMARIIKADGTEQDLGVISYWNQNPEKMKEWETKEK